MHYALTVVQFGFGCLWTSSEVFGCESLKIWSQLSIKYSKSLFRRIYNTPYEIDDAFIKNLLPKVTPSRNSEESKKFQKVSRFQIEEREQVPKIEKRFNLVK